MRKAHYVIEVKTAPSGLWMRMGEPKMLHHEARLMAQDLVARHSSYVAYRIWWVKEDWKVVEGPTA